MGIGVLVLVGIGALYLSQREKEAKAKETKEVVAPAEQAAVEVAVSQSLALPEAQAAAQAEPAALVAAGASPEAVAPLTNVAIISAAVAANPSNASLSAALSQATRESKAYTGSLPGGVQIGSPGTMGIYVDRYGYAHPTYIG